MSQEKRKHRVVIVGGGFGGVACARGLAGPEFEVTVVDRRSHHEFQPLLFQVATAALLPEAAQYPIRALLPAGVRCVQDAVTGIDADAQKVHTVDRVLPYDTLVVSPGARVELPELFPEALPLKDLADAVTLRDHLIDQFAVAYDQHARAPATVLVVGGGPTGVELAGEIVRLAREQLSGSSVVPRVILVEQTGTLLPGFSRRAAINAETALDALGVEVRLETTVTSTAPHRYSLSGARGETEVSAGTLIWAAGVRPSTLATELGLVDGNGRAIVDPHCRIAAHENIYAIGDVARFDDGAEVLPWVAAVAMQQGSYVAKSIHRRRSGVPVPHFHYVDRGMIAHVGQAAAVGQVFGVPLNGPLPWLLAELVHLVYLPGLENRIVAALDFVASQFGRRRLPSKISTGDSARFDTPSTSAEPRLTLH